MLCILRGPPHQGVVSRFAVSGGIAPVGEDRIRCARSSMRWLHVSVAELDSGVLPASSPDVGRTSQKSQAKARAYPGETRS